ncbi:thioredoxin-dependent thiol peroxidase [Geomicrobium sp. JCM 19055]|uniref:thioredoxin-dependent thiol peroxidase n=1 Tax=Geomicrobium sp. JCM 19055 TaxID=1460649 RepID=UPI00045ED8F5|nr:thioredoxin-dependent thiol peroxidase [Geomicrobium sp. JCM 19055]GAK01320.1 thiol peroxidase [Geomicrobium sp. JCM 19055]
MELLNKVAPDFTLPASNGENLSISDYKGSIVVLYFYPKDMTPGCTTQACDFRDAMPALSEDNVVVLGISPDSLERHDKFIQKHELPFTLIADEEQEAANKYGVWQLKKNFGKEYMGIVRSTFLIDETGTVINEWRNVRVKDHVEKVKEAIQAHKNGG